MASHGTLTCYQKDKCRCAQCRLANAEYQRSWRARNREQGRSPTTHGGRAYSNFGCKCPTCITSQREVQARHTTRATRNSDPAKQSVRSRRHRVAAQARTLDRATRHGRQWTGPELEILAREDLTIEQKALLLGRSYKAIDAKTWKLNREEPATSWLAGRRSRLHA